MASSMSSFRIGSGGVKRSLKALDRWIKSGNPEQPAEVEPLNVLLSRWKKEYIKKPDTAVQPSQLLETMDEWKRLLESSNQLGWSAVDSVSVSPDTKSYTILMEAAAAAKPQQPDGSKSNENNAMFTDRLLYRLLEDSKTDFAILPSSAAFGAVCKAWANVEYNNAVLANTPSIKIQEWIEKMQDLHDEGWPNLEPSVALWNMLLNAWSKEGKVQKIENTIQQMIKGDIPGVSPDTVSFSTLLAAYSRTGTVKAVKSAEILLEQMLELYDSGVESAKPNAVSFTNVIQSFAQQGNSGAAKKWLSKLEELYQETQDEDLRPDVRAYNTCLIAFTKTRDPRGAERFLKSCFPPEIKPNERSFNIILSGWAQVGDAYQAEATLMEMHELHVNEDLETKPSVISYNTVLSAYANLAGSISRNMGRNKKPLKEEDEPWKRAEKILEYMDLLYQKGDLQVKPNERTVNTVIDVCAKSGRPDAAERLVQKFLGNSGSSPAVRTWNTLLSACMYRGDLPRAKRFWKMMTKRDIVSYNTFLNCYVRASLNRKGGRGGKFGISKKQEADAVEAIYKHLQESHDVSPNRITHLAMINFWISRDEPERAETYLLQMAKEVQEQRAIWSRDRNKGKPRVAPPDRDLFHKVMSAWNPSRLPKKAESLLLMMSDLEGHGLDLRPTVETYNVLLECWAKSGRIESGERSEVILREMEVLSQTGDKSVKPNILTYNRVLNAWANSKNPTAVTRTDSLILEMVLKQDSTTMPDKYTYGTWLKTIALSNDADKSRRAKDVLKMMKIHDFAPNADLRKKIDDLGSLKSEI
ncbi:MAG: hypothetical protein SGILL_008928, partial [Bacillariaceae sp.]